MSETKTRLFSLDVFRGMTIALMIMVNIPGSWSYLYPPLQHADWHGCTPTDLVFPFFLFIVGTAMAFSFSKFDYKLNSESFIKIIERTFLIFFIGLLLNYYPYFKGELTNTNMFYNGLDVLKKLILSLIPFFVFIWILKKIFKYVSQVYFSTKSSIIKILGLLGIIIVFVLLIIFLPRLLNQISFYNKDVSNLRIVGVLQRIALAYGFASLLILTFKKKYIPYVAAFILLLYWFILWFFGGDSPYSLEGNIVRIIDLSILGPDHIWHGKGIPFDPEGLLSTLPAIATPLIGYLVGRYIKDNKEVSGNWFYYLILSGIVLIAFGQLWGLTFPINKSLWTSTYVIYTSGLAILLLSFFYWLIDIKGIKKWSSFFHVFGVNPLFAFVIHVLWVKVLLYIFRWESSEGKMVNGYSWLYNNVFVPIGGNLHGSFLFALSHILFFWLILFILYKKKIIIKI